MIVLVFEDKTESFGEAARWNRHLQLNDVNNYTSIKRYWYLPHSSQASAVMRHYKAIVGQNQMCEEVLSQNSPSDVKRADLTVGFPNTHYRGKVCVLDVCIIRHESYSVNSLCFSCLFLLFFYLIISYFLLVIDWQF